MTVITLSQIEMRGLLLENKSAHGFAAGPIRRGLSLSLDWAVPLGDLQHNKSALNWRSDVNGVGAIFVWVRRSRGQRARGDLMMECSEIVVALLPSWVPWFSFFARLRYVLRR